MMRIAHKFLFLIFLTTSASIASAQTLVESVAAIVGSEMVLLSDVEGSVVDAKASGNRGSVETLRCSALENLLINKLFLDQARIDSIEVTNDMVETEVNVRINDAIRRAGSEEALTSYFKKGLSEIREDIRKQLLDQEIIGEVQSDITQGITVTPNETKRYLASLPKDSLPIIPAKVQVSIIQIDPPDNEDNKAEARQKLLDIRREIMEGKSFNLLAILYSEDGSSSNGGELGYNLKGELEKPYADAAFSLTKGSISRIVETRYGFHLIQLIDKKEDMVNTRHILIRPKVKPEQTVRALTKLDSLAQKIRQDSIKFETAALRFSTHKDSRINGGKYVSADPSQRITWVSVEDLGADMYRKVRDLKIGEISDAFSTTDENGNTVFRIVRLDAEVPAHRVNLKDDYQYLYNAALFQKRSKEYEEWVKKKIGLTYIKVNQEYNGCQFLKDEGWLQ